MEEMEKHKAHLTKSSLLKKKSRVSCLEMNLVNFKCGELRRNRKIRDRAYLVFARRMGKHKENCSEHRLQPGTSE